MRIVRIALPAILCVLGAAPALANTTAQSLPYFNDWTNLGLIATDNDWSLVPGCQGFRGDDLTLTTGTDPQTLLADGTGTPANLYANKLDPTAFYSGGLAEYEVTDPTIALAGSGTADAPFLLVHLRTLANAGIQVSYDVRDIEAGPDNAIQRVALHFRIGNSGDWTNVPTAYIPDATDGPALATRVTHVTAMLPPTCDNKPLVQIRVMTTNAVGNDEWVGIDNISVTGNYAVPVAPTTWGALKHLFR